MAIQDRRYGVNIDMQGLQIKNHRLHLIAGDLGSPDAGDIWYDSGNQMARIYDGTSNRDLYANDDNMHNLDLITGIDDADEVLIADASDSFNYKKITRANLLLGAGTIEHAYYRVVAETGTANLDAVGSNLIHIRGDGINYETLGVIAGDTNYLFVISKAQSANTVFAGPTSGGLAAPTYRALLVADMPTGYNHSNWDTAYTHSQVVAGNPHSVTAVETGAEPALGNPASNGYLLSSTTSGTRSWVTPHVLGGQALDTTITAPAVGNDGWSVTWDDGNQWFELTNVSGSSGITVSGTPVAGQVGIWASASSMLGNSLLTADFTTNSVLILEAATTDDPIYRLHDGTNNFDIRLDTSAGDSFIEPYGDLIITPTTAGLIAIGATTAANALFSVENSIGTARTNIARFIDSAAAATFTVAEDGKVYAERIGGSGTGTSMVYYNRGTGEFTYADAPSGTAYWQKVGTDLRPATGGDDILLAATEIIQFVDANNYIYGPSSNTIRVVTNSGTLFDFGASNMTMYGTITTNSNHAYDLGATTHFLNDIFADRMYFRVTDSYIYDNAGDLTFYDASLGVAKTLTELATDTGYTHPHHSGHVTSVNDGATTVTVSAITGQSDIGSDIVAADELLISDTGTGIRRTTITRLQTYMQANLSFGGGGISITNEANNRVITSITTNQLNAEANLEFDGSSLFVGTLSTKYGTGAYTITLGGITSGNEGHLELVGNATTDVVIGAMSFHNSQSAASDKMIAKISGYRDDHNNAGKIVFHAADDAGTLMQSYTAKHDSHLWLTENASRLHLNGSALYPEDDDDIDVGASGQAFDKVWAHRLRLKGLTGSTTRMLTIDALGDVSAQAVPEYQVLYSDTNTTSYDPAGDTVFTVTLSNADYEGNTDGTKMFKVTLVGTYGPNTPGSSPTIQVFLKLGSTTLTSIELDVESSSSDFRLEFYATAISGSLSVTSANVIDEARSPNFQMLKNSALSHGTGSNLSVTIASGGSGSYSNVYMNYQLVEILVS